MLDFPCFVYFFIFFSIVNENKNTQKIKKNISLPNILTELILTRDCTKMHLNIKMHTSYFKFYFWTIHPTEMVHIFSTWMGGGG